VTTIFNTAAGAPRTPEEQGFAGDRSPINGRTRPTIVREARQQISATHGLSAPERDVLTESLDYMRQYGPGAFASIEAGYGQDAEQTVRRLTNKVRSDIAIRQRRAGMRRHLAATAFEARNRKKEPKFGSHIVAVMPDATARDRLVDSLNGSTVYGKNILAKPVTDWSGLTGYLLKEATPQAAYKKNIRRVGGSIPLGVQGGDRVIPSRDLKDVLVNVGRIKPYQRTYAKRVPRASAFLAEIEVRYRDSLFDDEPPLPLLAAPPRPKAPPRKREKILPPSLPLAYPPSIADLLAGLGPTHGAVAERIGISRQQVTNIIVGRFGVSRPIAQRVLELARAA
jgi:hypothetical protein